MRLNSKAVGRRLLGRQSHKNTVLSRKYTTPL
ncbi:hypothetical protein BFJ67_g13107 [Fusarium oxysporum f. sp. cepae]|nr:hypothetical protein BFJ67_g13107 [Fusarium oxysporum f. sp. cepae]